MRGFFFVFDGIDGCGKSTQLDRAAKRLRRAGFRVLATREPGGAAISEEIRRIILSAGNTAMVRECELLLYGAARAQHVREIIAPAISSGAIVLCDRFDLATVAYQGFGRKIPRTLLKSINDIAAGGVRPDLTFVFDISVAAAFRRLAAMGKTPDRLEQGGRAFFNRVAAGFRTLARRNPRRIVLLDAERSVERLEHEIGRRISAMVGTRSEEEKNV